LKGGVGGGPVRQHLIDPKQNSRQVIQHIVIPKADDLITLCIQKGGSPNVMGFSVFRIVLSAIYFNDRPSGAANEIAVIGANANLPVEAMP